MYAFLCTDDDRTDCETLKGPGSTCMIMQDGSDQKLDGRRAVHTAHRQPTCSG